MLRSAFLLGLVSLVAACAEPARVGKMVAPDFGKRPPAGSELNNGLCITAVTGGEETNPLWTSEVDNTAFRGALQQSLANNGLAAPAGAGCAYDLEANLLGLAQPTFGFDFEVTANTNYSVLEHGMRTPFYQSTVTTPFTATMSDAFIGVERLKLANEGAVRANIGRFIGGLIEHSATLPAAEPAPGPSS